MSSSVVTRLSLQIVTVCFMKCTINLLSDMIFSCCMTMHTHTSYKRRCKLLASCSIKLFLTHHTSWTYLLLPTLLLILTTLPNNSKVSGRWLISSSYRTYNSNLFSCKTQSLVERWQMCGCKKRLCLLTNKDVFKEWGREVRTALPRNSKQN